MGSLESRLWAAEGVLVANLLVEMMVEAEIQAMLAVLEASDDIEQPLYERVVGILTNAGYIEEAGDGS